MKKPSPKYYLLLWMLFSSFVIGFAQNPQETYMDSEIIERKIDKESWAQAIDGLDYNEKEDKKEEEEIEEITATPPPSAGSSPRSYPSGGSSDFWAGVFKALFIIIVIAAIVLLAVHFMGAGTFRNPANKKFTRGDTKITIDNIEDHIYETELERFIREAVEKNNYTLAIRLYYLAIIKELSLNRTIKWKKDKTNKDYIKEMRKTNLFQAFREVTRIFERVWYGKTEIGKTEYLAVKPKFEALVKAAQERPGTIQTNE